MGPLWRRATCPLAPQQLLLGIHLHLLDALQCRCVARLMDLLLWSAQTQVSHSMLCQRRYHMLVNMDGQAEAGQSVSRGAQQEGTEQEP